MADGISEIVEPPGYLHSGTSRHEEVVIVDMTHLSQLPVAINPPLLVSIQQRFCLCTIRV